MLLLCLLFYSSTASLIDLAMYSSWVSSKPSGIWRKNRWISRDIFLRKKTLLFFGSQIINVPTPAFSADCAPGIELSKSELRPPLFLVFLMPFWYISGDGLAFLTSSSQRIKSKTFAISSFFTRTSSIFWKVSEKSEFEISFFF